MGSDFIGKTTDIVAAIIVMMVIPVLWGLGTENELLLRFAACRAQEFAEDACFSGSITSERYDVFLRSLSAAGGTFFVEMECEIPCSEPVYENDIFTGRISRYSSYASNGAILDEINSRGQCRMSQGTVFRIRIRKGKLSRSVSAVVS